MKFDKFIAIAALTTLLGTMLFTATSAQTTVDLGGRQYFSPSWTATINGNVSEVSGYPSTYDWCNTLGVLALYQAKEITAQSARSLLRDVGVPIHGRIKVTALFQVPAGCTEVGNYDDTMMVDVVVDSGPLHGKTFLVPRDVLDR
jgi:hypothetical protein